MKTNIFAFHGYTELYLANQWVKATPTFNKRLCETTGIIPLDFDGKNHAVFHEYNRNGSKHMQYLHDHGRFADFPYQTMFQVWKEHYPHLTPDHLKKRQDA